MFTQQVRRCEEHTGCAVIVCTADRPVRDQSTGTVLYPAGATIWSSHLDDTVHVAHRINRSYPAYDHRGPVTPVRYEPPCSACRVRLVDGPGA